MNIFKKILFSVYKPVVAKRIYRSTIYKWRDIQLYIPPGVFHPKYFFSTRFLLDRILKSDLKNKKILELGAGSGLISIAAAKQGAVVTASDISERAVNALKENSIANKTEINIVQSDLFDSVGPQQFDMIVINPPYYPKDPRNELEVAWYCGANFEYFEKLFSQLGKFLHERTEVLMVLSEDCNLERIFGIASENHFNFIEVVKKKFWWEWNMIYKIEKR